MDPKIKKIKKFSLTVLHHKFTHDVAIMQVGSVASKLIAFATSLLFARMLGPEGYGMYSIVFALAGVVMLFQDVGAGQGVTNLFAKAIGERTKPDTISLLSYMTKITLVVLVTTGLIGVIISPFLGLWFYQSIEIGMLAALLVGANALSLFFPLTQIVLQSLRNIVPLTILETLQKILSSGLALLFVFFGFAVLGIVMGHFITMVIMSIIALVVYQRLTRSYTILPRIKTLFTHRLSWNKVKYYFSYGFQIAVTKNLVKLNASIPLLILAAVLPTHSGIGFYKIAFAYISLPMFLLGPVSRLLNVQFPQTELASHTQLFKRFWQVTGLSMIISAALTVVTVLLGPWLITLFYGQDFSSSIPIMYGLSLFPLLSGMGIGLGALFRTLHKMKVAITINIVTFLLIIPVSYFLISHYSIKGLVVVTLLFTILPNGLSLGYFFWLSKKTTT